MFLIVFKRFSDFSQCNSNQKRTAKAVPNECVKCFAHAKCEIKFTRRRSDFTRDSNIIGDEAFAVGKREAPVPLHAAKPRFIGRSPASLFMHRKVRFIEKSTCVRKCFFWLRRQDLTRAPAGAWSLAVTTVHRTVALCRSSFKSCYLKIKTTSKRGGFNLVAETGFEPATSGL